MFEREGLQYHIRCKKGDVGRYVLLPGDPFRTDKIAQYLEGAQVIAHNREHKTWTGFLMGEKVSVTSTGMGCPSAAIAVEELIACGADTFIRVGTAGRINEQSMDETMIGGIVTAAVRGEGTTRQYVPIEYPAVADRVLVDALARAAAQMGLFFAEGISYTKDSFYSQVHPDEVPLSEEIKSKQEVWARANVLLTEMEAAAIFVVSSIRGCRASGIMAFSDAADQAKAVDSAIRVACEAIKLLIEQERK